MERFSKEQIEEFERIKELPEDQRAEAIATYVHQTQVDKIGEPYINHPRRVAQNVNLYFDLAEDAYTPKDREIAYQAAWLHDVLEDAAENGFPELASADLGELGISKEVLEVVELLTKRVSTSLEPKEDPYYQAIAANEIASAVKLCDLTDNSNEKRASDLFAKTGFSKVSYYSQARYFIAPKSQATQFFNVRKSMPLEITDEEWDLNLKRVNSTSVDFFSDTLEFMYYRALNSGMSKDEAADEAIRQNEKDI
jgi:(p)ppGpp synthase/HD superfamily hydrolase